MNQTKQKSKLPLILVSLAVAATAISILSWSSRSAQPANNPELSPVQQVTEQSYTFTADKPMTAQELLEANATVEFTDFGAAGNFVDSINGLAGNPEHFWGFYVNDAFAEAGVGQTNLQPGDTIRFTYEDIEPLP